MTGVLVGREDRQRGHPERGEVGGYKSGRPRGAGGRQSLRAGWGECVCGPLEPGPGPRTVRQHLSAFSHRLCGDFSQPRKLGHSRSQCRMQWMVAHVIEIITQLCWQGDGDDVRRQCPDQL